MKLRAIFYLCVLTLSAHGAFNKSAEQPVRTLSANTPPADPRSSWLLGPFVKLAEKQPERLLLIGQKLFHLDRLKEAAKSRKLAHEWQHRLAMVGALSEIFAPERNKKIVTAEHRRAAREILNVALRKDPSLLVRDGAVEAVRRILHMHPNLSQTWLTSLEGTFLDAHNSVEGEGLFIRETILNTMREASLPLRKPIKQAALRDQSSEVRNLVRMWESTGYESLR